MARARRLVMIIEGGIDEMGCEVSALRPEDLLPSGSTARCLHRALQLGRETGWSQAAVVGVAVSGIALVGAAAIGAVD